MQLAKALDEVLNEAPQWRDRRLREHIPMERWNGDHWSLLAFVESRVTENQGLLDWSRMRLSRRNWPMLYQARHKYSQLGGEDAADRYGLRLTALSGPHPVEVLKGYCEGDALMDLVDTGLVAIEMPPVSVSGGAYLRPDGLALGSPSPSQPVTGLVEHSLMPWARFTLTDRGRELADRLRGHRAQGRRFDEFAPALNA